MGKDTGNRKRTIGWILLNLFLMIGLSCLLIVITFSWIKSYTRHGQYISVPDVSGMFEEEAGQALAAVGLKYEVLDYKYDRMTVEGGVIEQKPKSGSYVKDGRTIYLTLNSIGLAMGTSYNANLVINTNDENLPQVMIPVLLAVTDGVEETAEQMASIYPNPATSMVTLEGENLNSVAIYNVAGQLIRVEKLGAMVNNINMDVEAGVYFFSVYDNYGNNSVQRVVIVK